MDIGTGLALLGSAKLVEKLLGPTAEYVGEGIKYWTERGAKNIGHIFQIAARKLGDKINEDSAVPPKVLKGIITEGAFCEDPIAAEYFGGVLASSRSGTPRDDRGAVLIALVSRLSTYQIRSHYILYTVVRDLFIGSELRIATTAGRLKMRTFVPFSTYLPAMAFEGVEAEKWNILMGHVIWGLCKEDLIGDAFATGSVENLKQFFKAPAPGIVFEPSAIGAELFLWAQGRSEVNTDAFLSPTMELHRIEEVFIGPGCERVPEEDAIDAWWPEADSSDARRTPKPLH